MTLDSLIFKEFPQEIITGLLQKLNEMIKDARTVFGSSNGKKKFYASSQKRTKLTQNGESCP
jgi:hypothetical protein